MCCNLDCEHCTRPASKCYGGGSDYKKTANPGAHNYPKMTDGKRGTSMATEAGACGRKVGK